VADWSDSARDFDLGVVDFLHHFQQHATRDSIAEEPPLLADRFPEGRIADCYLAAVAVELSTQLGTPRPAWSHDPRRFSPVPWFASPGPPMRALLLLESPAGFRERNLFVTANALSVA
jgi:hypothetical protein